ncbi:MAG: DeoR/GlpR family DNA-binding transcription regulator [Phycisphaerae bacterium]|jgi:DeoR/GlpR family transcriptional regulator of sugar metabolism
MLLNIKERKEKIISAAIKNGFVSVTEMAKELGVCDATVRRDIQAISEEGLLDVAHGGAFLAKNSDYSFISKSQRNVEAKKTIAQLAAEMVKDGDQIFLDSGTTCFEMTQYLRAKKSVSIIVNSVRIAEELNAPGLNVLMLGGKYRPDRMDCIGPIAYQTLDRLRGYTVFVGTDGMSRDFGFTSIDVESASIFGLAVKNSKRAILLADSSKFDKPALYKTTSIRSISTIITEKRPAAEWCKFFDKYNIKLVYPE